MTELTGTTQDLLRAAGEAERTGETALALDVDCSDKAAIHAELRVAASRDFLRKHDRAAKEAVIKAGATTIKDRVFS